MITEKVLEAIKNAAHKATFEELYMHEVRHGSGVVDWDLSTCESDDEDADGDSIARIYDRRNINYFIEMTPERAIALVAEIQRQREEIAALRAEVESRQRMYETEGEMRRQSERLVEKLTWFNNALDAKPDAAPAPVEAVKPMPKAEVVTWVDRTANRVFVTYGSDDAKSWVEQQAAQYGMVFHEENRRQIVINVFATYDANDVAEYLRKMQD